MSCGSSNRTKSAYGARNGHTSAENDRPISAHPSMESTFASPRLAERDELQTLNSRLASYIRHIRELKESASFIDSDIFLQSVKVLEEELMTMKSLYEKELNITRIQVDDVTRAKNRHALEERKSKTLASDLKNRLELENQQNQQLVIEMHSLQRAVAHRDNQIEQMRIDAQQPAQQLQEVQRMYDQALRQQEDSRKRFESEQLARQEAEDRADTTYKKLQFQTTLFEQEKGDLEERLATANGTIQTLEEKLRELSHHDQTMSAMLVQVRSSAENEVRRYQEESETRHGRHLTELKAQIDEDDKRITELNEETLKLNGQITELIGEIRNLEAQVGSLEHLKNCLQSDLKQEKERGREFAQRAQLKLRELQEVLVAKMKELNAAKDAQIPLKAEIESYKALLEAEERRLKIGPSDYPELPQLPSVQYNHMPSYSSAECSRPVGPVKVPCSSGWGARQVVPSSSGHYGTGDPAGRIKSAPATFKSRPLNLIPANVGQGKDYFEEMFRDLRLKESLRNEEYESKMAALPKPHPPDEGSTSQLRPSFVAQKDSVCSVGDVTIMDIQPEGKYVKLFNASTTKSEEIGNFLLQQNISGHPVAVYRFPPQLYVPPGGMVTVWAAESGEEADLHRPPTDFLFREQSRWGSGPECTTILCRANGQAVAWSTPFMNRPRANRQEEEVEQAGTENQPLQNGEHKSSGDVDGETLNLALEENGQAKDTEEEMEPELPIYDMNLNARRQEPVYLRRQKESPPGFAPPKHPHGLPPSNYSHPSTSQARPRTYGNDNSSVNRQSRSQSSRPDPIPGAPYAGASAQRMGSASLRNYQPPPSAGQANRAMLGCHHGPPTPFISAFQQEYSYSCDTGATNFAQFPQKGKLVKAN